MASSDSKVVVVTGGSAGIGRAVARRFAEDGHAVAVLARNTERVEATCLELRGLGGTPLGIPIDVADWEQVDAAAARVESELGPIDLWVNNAMVSVFGPAQQIRPDEFRRVTEVTYLGYVHGTLAALQRMAPRDQGTILQVGSALAFRGIPLQAPYCAAKHAIQGFTESLRTELLHEGSNVRLQEVHLPAVNTPQFGWVKSMLPRKAQPVPPIYQPEVIADAIHDAVESGAHSTFIGASAMLTRMGTVASPMVADWYLARTGFDSQQTDELEDPDRPNNLWDPVPGDPGARGSFSDRARSNGKSISASRLGAACVAGIAGAGFLLGTLGTVAAVAMKHDAKDKQ